MSLPWVRQQYGVPAIRGGIVRFDGQLGRILSATHHLHIRLNDGKNVWIHPTWRVEYLECIEAVPDRGGIEEPCGRPAVVYRPDPDSSFGEYPVCRRHRPPRLTELRETPVCVTCRGDETVPLVGAKGGQFTPCPDCVIRGIPAVE